MQACGCTDVGWTEVKKLKVEADFSAEPLWCAECSYNINSECFALSQALLTELYEWIYDYGMWIDFETDKVVTNGVALEAAHNARGAELTELVKQQLPQYDIVFSPSTYAVRYRED